MSFLPRPQPRSAVTDVIRAIRTPIPHKLGIAGVCAALTWFFIALLVHDFSPKPVYRPPEITYVKSFAKNRTLAQIKADQKRDAPIEAAAKAKEKADDEAATAQRRASFERIHQTLKSYGIN